MLNINNIRLIAPYRVEGLKNVGLGELEQWLRRHNIIGLDCETTGLDPLDSEIVMLQLGTVNRQFVIDTRFVDISVIWSWLENKTIVGQNAKFDYKQILHHYNYRLPKVFDIMNAEKVLNNNKLEERSEGFYALSGMASRYLGAEFEVRIKTKGKRRKVIAEQGTLFPDYSFSKGVRDEFSKIGNKPFTAQQIIYGANDVWMPLLIRRKQLKQLSEDSMTQAIKLENRFLPVLAEMELTGIFLDGEQWMENYESYKELLVKAEEKLLELFDINWNSSKQVVKVFKELGIPTQIIDKTKSIGENKIFKDSVQENHIIKYKDKYPIIKDYLEYKGLQKLCGTYGEKFLKHIHKESGRVHSDFIQLITTGRLASTNPNLQQIPNKEKAAGFRECFKPAPGYKFILCDYSAQESRILADVAKERSMIEFFNGKETDMHSYTAAKMFKVPVSKKENSHYRQIGKILNFSIAYGAGAFKISENFSIPEKEAQDFINKFYQAYPDLEIYFKRRHAHAKKNGYILIDRYSKRRVYIKEYQRYLELEEFITRYRESGWIKYVPKKIWSEYYILKGEIERDSQNYPIQGLGANMTKLAACLFREWAIANKIDARIVLLVHDEIIVECIDNEKVLRKVKKALQFFMEEAGNHILPNKLVKIVASPIIAEYWAHD